MTTREINQPLHGPLYNFGALGFQPGEVVVVTGAGSGIGRAVALSAGKSGLAVALWDMNRAGAQETEKAIVDAGGKALSVQANVGDDNAVRMAWDATEKLGPCRYLVNNAGPASVDEGPFEDNLKLAIGSMYRVTTTWLERHGDHASSVVNMASVAGNFLGGGGRAFYPTAKGGIAAYTRHLAVVHKGRPRANAVAPGFTITPRTAPYLDSPAMRQSVERIPLGRMGFPEDIAAATLFLLSPAAAYINGVLLPVDGGWIHA